MAKKGSFSIHDLYPADYEFDWEAFEADPESYVFTPEDIAYNNAMELERYEREVPMTAYEKKLLREWVMSGHSPRENPGSKYYGLMYPDPDFLTVYRLDREIQRDTRGMNEDEKIAYIKGCTGWRDDLEEKFEGNP